MNERPLGAVAITSGPAMAAADRLKIDIVGEGGHGAYPHMSRDPVVAAAHVVTALQSVVARNVGPFENAVISVTSVKSGEAFNVIPPSATLLGTVRTFEPDVRERVHARIRETAEHVARGLGCEARVSFDGSIPAVRNDAPLAERLRAAAARVPGVTQVLADRRTMGSEDMAYFLDRVPGVFAFVGSSDAARGLDAPHHSPKFDFDERALGIGAALLAEALVELTG